MRKAVKPVRCTLYPARCFCTLYAAPCTLFPQKVVATVNRNVLLGSLRMYSPL